MENMFITKLILDKVRNLDYIEIPLSNEKIKHLIITGKDGSGKTTILDGLANLLNNIAVSGEPMQTEELLLAFKSSLEYAKKKNLSEFEILEREKSVLSKQKKIDDIKRGFQIEMNTSLKAVKPAFEAGEFIIAYYKADRIFKAEIPKHVEKVELKQSYTITETPRNSFVKYLLDMKMTQALAAAGNKQEKEQKIQVWFTEFEQLLQRIFNDNQLRLEFDEDTFRFYIKESGKEPFDFNTLSSGYAAVLDIVVDLMIRMEKLTDKKFQYDLPGIVLIDEIETHLHLELQKQIMELLTTMFPNIQFIVSTHSPFILNSLDNVVIYDLEQKILVEKGLSDIPYDGIVEGYFNASVLSDKLKTKFERYKELVNKEIVTDNDLEELTSLEMFLDEIPDYLALGITTEYQRLKLGFLKREDING